MATVYTSTNYGYYTPRRVLPAPSVWYDFSQGNGNENFSTTIKDISGNGHDGIVTGMTAANNYLPNEFSTGALHINNTNNYNGGQYISLPSSFYSNARQSIIVCMGVYRMGLLNYYSGYKNVYCGSYNSSNGRYWYVGLDSNNNATFEWSDASSVESLGVDIYSWTPTVFAFDLSSLSNYNYFVSLAYYNNQIYRQTYAITYSSLSVYWDTFQSYGMTIGRSLGSNFEYSNLKIGHIALWDNIDPVATGNYESPILSGLCSAYFQKYL